MLYQIAQTIKNRFPYLWDCVEKVNEWLFILRYGKRLDGTVKEKQEGPFCYRMLVEEDAEKLAGFFAHQPEDAFVYFNPHKFDPKTIKRLLRNRSFLAYGAFDGKKLIGYYFLRAFFVGKAYLGKMVDVDCRGKGIGKQMCINAMDVATVLGMHMCETISKNNLSSLYSTQKVLDVKVLEELPDDYLYIEDFPKGTLNLK